jgi:hypothetical protein
MPVGTHWTQIGYGQGEGQVEVDGCEWGIYWNRQDEMSMTLHRGRVEAESALAFVREVVRRITLETVAYKIFFLGEETEMLGEI